MTKDEQSFINSSCNTIIPLLLFTIGAVMAIKIITSIYSAYRKRTAHLFVLCNEFTEHFVNFIQINT